MQGMRFQHNVHITRHPGRQRYRRIPTAVPGNPNRSIRLRQ